MEESHKLDMSPGLMALLRGGDAETREVHLRNYEAEEGMLRGYTWAGLCAGQGTTGLRMGWYYHLMYNITRT